MKSDRTINVCFAVHDSVGTYSKFTAVSIESLLSHTEENIRIFVLHDKVLPDKVKDDLQEVAGKHSQEMTFCEVKLPELFHTLPGTVHFTIGTLLRLLMLEVLPEKLEKIIYLDSDLLFNTDIKALWEQDMGDALILGKLDRGFTCMQDESFEGGLSFPHFLLEDGTLGKTEYINAGVMVMNLEGIRREKNFFEDCLEFFREYPACPYLDQDALNFVFAGRKGLLEERFNHYTRDLRGKNTALEDCIYHYSGDIPCPGSGECFDEEFFRVLGETPWRDAIAFSYYDFYQFFRKQINLLIERRVRFLDNPKYSSICMFCARETAEYRRIMNELEEKGVRKKIFFADNNPEKWGQKLDGKEIVNPAELKKLCGHCLVIVTREKYYDAVADQLEEMGYYRDIDVWKVRTLFFEDEISKVVAL
ncbi:MAG: hypothetical protein K5985_07105 [Lachnospiraceae bacterium]|nr:hypothetical protein [Lachnospiraceae bacterium]